MDLTPENDALQFRAAWAAEQAQQSVIGVLMIEPEKLTAEIMQRLRPEDFTDATFRTLFTACR